MFDDMVGQLSVCFYMIDYGSGLMFGYIKQVQDNWCLVDCGYGVELLMQVVVVLCVGVGLLISMVFGVNQMDVSVVSQVFVQ